MVEVFKILYFKLKNWMILKNIFVNINEIIDEVVIECNPEGLKFNGLDRSHICFFNCNISKNFFDGYNIDEILYLYVDLDELVKVLKRGKNKDCLVFKGHNSTFDVIFKNKNTRIFTITQIDMDNNSREMPNLNFSVDYKIDFEFINDSLKDAAIYSDRLKICCYGEKLILSCDGIKGNYRNEYNLDICVGDCSATYTVSWLMKIFNTKLSSDALNIKMSDDFPMLVEIEEKNIIMKYLLAPRLGHEED